MKLTPTQISSPLLAVASGDVISKLFWLLLYAVAGLVLWGFGRWLGKTFEAPPIVIKVWDALFALVAVVILINFLLSLAGRPLF